VFLISLKAGNTGLNLTAADYVYIVDPWWNPAVEQQAIDRTHRIGQTKNIFAYRLICRNTIEEKMIQLQERKRALANDLVADDGAIIKRLTKDDLLFLLS
jgi:non-specific serine/threonine protein kinase